MPNLFRHLLEVLAGSTESDLRRQIQYLKAENEILRGKIAGRIRVTPAERSRLIRLGKPLGSAIRHLVSIVKPDTFVRWVNQAGQQPRRTTGHRPGRPRTAEDIRQLVLKIARETNWGYTRILGELRKLGIRISRGTVVNILKEAGLPTGPQRGESTWDQFIQSHARTLWACDFLSRKVLTPRGWVDVFVLLFIHVATRRVHASPSTTRPDAVWVAEQARTFAEMHADPGHPAQILIRDRDAKFGAAFDGALRLAGMTPHPLPHCAPNLNAHIERFIQTLQVECLDRFIVLGTRHMDYLVAEFVKHYNCERPHTALDHRVPVERASPPLAADVQGTVHCRTRLGGVLRHYHRQAA